jgi:glycosyltransferase involved in cell wall biosynthesis
LRAAAMFLRQSASIDRAMLKKITPVLLTYNEAANIRRTLAQLSWASRIVVVDSFSTDATASILREFANVSFYQRKFDSQARQWQFATQETAIATPWMLALDADYVVTGALIAELATLSDDEDVAAYKIAFDYAIFSRRLAASLYPANTLLLRMGRFQVIERGHAEVWRVEGLVKRLKSKVIHDDWKSLDRWIWSQLRYMQLERESLAGRRGLKTWLREHPPLMPIVVFLYCLFGKRLIFAGRAGMYYALQRSMAEAILSLLIMDRSLRPSGPDGGEHDGPSGQ